MLNMNSPTVQNLMQSGFNPFSNDGYIHQQEPQYYYGNSPYTNTGFTPQYNYTYNPYVPQYQQPQRDMYINWENSYDPMPNVIINEARGINSQIVQPINNTNYCYGNYYNNQAFNGYMNPVMMRNQAESERIRQREAAIQQGKIWRTLLKGQAFEDYDLDIDEAVERVESFYYYEPPKTELSMKDKIIIDKNNHIAEIEADLLYRRQNNIPIVNPIDIKRAYVCNYYNSINEIIGDVDNCDMYDYFTRVYPELRQRELSKEVDKFNKNLKNRYNSNIFNNLVDKDTKEKPDSYYAKLMETFAENGVRLETSSGLIITPDEMEIRLPERLLKNKQDVYYEQRKKFFNRIFNKEVNGNG